MELLSSITSARLNPAVGTRIVAETGGNPLALVELARELSPDPQALLRRVAGQFGVDLEEA